MLEYEYTAEVYKADKRKKEGMRRVDTIEFVAKDIDTAEELGMLLAGQDDKLIIKVFKTYNEVRNAMNGKIVEEHYATPFSCSVASESYWCS